MNGMKSITREALRGWVRHLQERTRKELVMAKCKGKGKKKKGK